MDSIFDIVIIGGGINGCGIAADAAMRGLKTLLIEKDDLASKTSSSSTKLIHGGSGVWGPVPMPANAQVNEAEAKTLAAWVLTIK